MPEQRVGEAAVPSLPLNTQRRGELPAPHTAFATAVAAARAAPLQPRRHALLTPLG